MAKNNIELAIGSKFDGEGFQKLNSALKSSSASVGRTTRSVAGVVDALSGLDGAVGKTAGKIGGFASQFMQGGVFGVAMGLASIAIAKVTEHFAALKKAASDASDYIRTTFVAALGDVDAKTQKIVGAFQRENAKISKQLGRDNQDASGVDRAKNTVVAMRDIFANNQRATKAGRAGLEEAQEKLAKATEMAANYLMKKQQAEDRIAAIQDANMMDASAKIRALNDARAAAKKVEEEYAEEAKTLKSATEAVRKAEERVATLAYAEEESRLDMLAANKHLANEREKEAKDAAKRKAEEDRKWSEMKLALEEKMRLAEEEAEDERKINEINVKIAKEREAKEKERQRISDESAKKIKDIDKQIANLKKEAAKLEAEAARARGGKTFGQWQREERNIARKAALDAKKQENVIKNAERERDNIGGRIFDRNGKLRKSANPFDIKRFKQLSEFINKQDPNNNGLLQQAQQLEQQKQQMIQATKTAVEAIATAMKNGGVAM